MARRILQIELRKCGPIANTVRAVALRLPYGCDRISLGATITDTSGKIRALASDAIAEYTRLGRELFGPEYAPTDPDELRGLDYLEKLA